MTSVILITEESVMKLGNIFVIFLSSFITDFASMSRKLGEKWHSLAEKEKTKWKHKQRALMLRHKNVPALSRMKKHVQKASNPKAR